MKSPHYEKYRAVLFVSLTCYRLFSRSGETGYRDSQRFQHVQQSQYLSNDGTTANASVEITALREIRDCIMSAIGLARTLDADAEIRKVVENTAM